MSELREKDILKIAGHEFTSRLFVGTGKFSSPREIPGTVTRSGTQMVTVALRRVDMKAGEENILEFVPDNVTLLPNTSGARNAEEAIRIARIARELGCGDFVKIEVIHDMKYLLPDNVETLKATEVLSKEGFIVLPYMVPDPMDCKRFEDAGASAVMPLGAPIGTNRGIKVKEMIDIIIEISKLPVVVDAGIGAPSHAALAMEMGADAVLVNTAIATAQDPATVGEAFGLAVRAGRMAYLSRLREQQITASASSPLTGFLG